MSSHRLILPDTNLFFECQRLEALPWYELDGDPLELLLAKPVLDEIDKHKKSSGRTRKRALETFKRVRSMLTASTDVEIIQEAGPRVLLRLATNLAVSEKHGASLDLYKTDDRLAAILTALIDVGKDAVLLTHDTGPASTARALGLPFFLIPDHWLRPTESTPEEKEIDALKERIAKYSFQEPRLKLRLASHPDSELTARRVIERFEPLDKSDIDAAISRLKEVHPLKTDFSTPPRKSRTLKLGSFVVAGDVTYVPPTEDEQRTYIDEIYPAWLDACRERLSTLHEVIEITSPPLELRFELKNDGSRPANNLRIEFETGGDIRLLRPDSVEEDEDDLDEQAPLTGPAAYGLTPLPEPPTPPQWKTVISPPEQSAHGNTSGQNALPGLTGQIEGPATAINKLVQRDALMRHLTLGLGAADLVRDMAQPTRLEVPDFPRPYIPPPHDPEAFYYDHWSPGLPVQTGALTCDRFRHRSGVEAFEFDVLFRDCSAVDATVLCTVHADNVTEPVQLRVRVTQVVEVVKPTAQLEQLLNQASVPPPKADPEP